MIDGGIIMQPWQVVAIVTIYDIAKSLFIEYSNWKNETVEDEDDSESEETNEINDVLDRIENEIKANMYDLYKNQDICYGMEMALDIIEKYKTERKEISTSSIHCQHTDEEIAKSFIDDVEAVKEQLSCGDQMDFPNTFDEFVKDYGFKDKDEVYTNGSELIPVFRVKQWLEHISTTKNNIDKKRRK